MTFYQSLNVFTQKRKQEPGNDYLDKFKFGFKFKRRYFISLFSYITDALLCRQIEDVKFFVSFFVSSVNPFVFLTFLLTLRAGNAVALKNKHACMSYLSDTHTHTHPNTRTFYVTLSFYLIIAHPHQHTHTHTHNFSNECCTSNIPSRSFRFFETLLKKIVVTNERVDAAVVSLLRDFQISFKRRMTRRNAGRRFRKTLFLSFLFFANEAFATSLTLSVFLFPLFLFNFFGKRT